MRSTPDWPARDLLAHRVAVTPTTTAVVDAADGRAWSYRDLDRRVTLAVDRVRTTLDGVPDGASDRPRVALAASTSLEFVVGLFATWRSGALAVPVAPTTPASVLEARLDAVDASLLVATARPDPWGAVADDRQIVGLHDVSAQPATDDARVSRDRQPANWDPTEPALVCFTSGTTGDPKGVTLSHRNLVASANGSAARLGLASEERWLDCLPTNHVGGLAPIVRSTVYGTTVVCQREFDDRATAAAMADHDVTVVSLVPTQLRRLLDGGWTPPQSLRAVLLGGAPAGDALLADARAADVPVCPTYGTTETASQIATVAPTAEDGESGTVGPPLVVADVTIVDPDDGSPLDAGEVGELVVDGPIVTPGYLDAAATADAVGAYGLHTGDLASRDADGRLTIHGRLDDAIQTGGETVHPRRVADVIEALPAVATATVVGVPDHEWGERVAAVVVSTDGESIDGASVEERCRAALPPHAVPSVVRVVDCLPRTASGTVDRAAVRDRLAEAAGD